MAATDPLADRLIASTTAPTGTYLLPWAVRRGDYDIIDLWYIDRVVHYNVVYAPRTPPPPNEDFRARRERVKAEEAASALAGTVELRRNLTSWIVFRPDRRTAPFHRHVGDYPTADAAVAELIRLDRGARRRARQRAKRY